MYEPKFLDRYKRPGSYLGPDWYEYFVAAGQHRDSDTLTRSNFRCILKMLGGESETVLIIRDSHWAVGWVETLYVHESCEEALRTADKIREKLLDYPVVDEGDWLELEFEEACKAWEWMSVRGRVEVLQKCGGNVFAARRSELPQEVEISELVD